MPTEHERPRAAIAERIKLAREQAGLSQSQVAKLLGLHRPSVSEMEAGRRRVSAEELRALADLYGVSIGWLAGNPLAGDALDGRVELAARELSKLRPEDLERILLLLKTLKREGR